MAAEQLLAAGCRRLAVVSSAARTASLIGRIDAFCAGAGAAHATVKVWAEREATDYETGREAARALLAKQRIDGVFCVTDLLALGFLDAARFEHGRRVPDDLSLIGFDDIAQAAWDAYRLTTFRQPVGNLAAAVMKAIRRRMKDPVATHDLETVPIELVVRSTVRGFAEKGLAA